MPDLVVLIADHRSKMTFVSQLNCLYPETDTQNSIEGCRGTAALKMA
jgi:hypothetical protein